MPGFSVLLAAVLKYILNITLIPIYGEIIVPITTIIYHTVNCFIVTFILYKTLKTKPDYTNIFIKPLISSAIMGIVVLGMYYLFGLINISVTIQVNDHIYAR